MCVQSSWLLVLEKPGQKWRIVSEICVLIRLRSIIAKFVTILMLVPWAVDFLVHYYLMVPFLRRWVEEVPLAAEVLDEKESQKLHMIDRLKLERQRVRFEAEIGKAPPLSDEELNEHIRDEA